MKAVTFHGRRDVRVEQVPNPTIEQPTDAIVRVTSSGICGSDLHLYEVMAPFMDEGDILGHEPMGIVEATGEEATNIKPGDRVVIPFNMHGDPLAVEDLATHKVPLDQAPHAYEIFQKKQDGAIKVLLQP